MNKSQKIETMAYTTLLPTRPPSAPPKKGRNLFSDCHYCPGHNIDSSHEVQGLVHSS